MPKKYSINWEDDEPVSYEVDGVLYDPEHPLEARIQSMGSSLLMWILPGITGILGLAFLGAVIAVRKLMPSGETDGMVQDDSGNIHPR